MRRISSSIKPRTLELIDEVAAARKIPRSAVIRDILRAWAMRREGVKAGLKPENYFLCG